MTDAFGKSAYVAPQLVELGSFEDLTKATATGSYADMTIYIHHAIPTDHSS
jgi:hypothetical protein